MDETMALLLVFVFAIPVLDATMRYFDLRKRRPTAIYLWYWVGIVAFCTSHFVFSRKAWSPGHLLNAQLTAFGICLPIFCLSFVLLCANLISRRDREMHSAGGSAGDGAQGSDRADPSLGAMG